jgi:hypothetical protein
MCTVSKGASLNDRSETGASCDQAGLFEASANWITAAGLAAGRASAVG